MQITINGERREVRAATLAELIAEMGLADRPVATAVNGNFAPKGQRAETPLAPGDSVEILSPMQGG